MRAAPRRLTRRAPRYAWVHSDGRWRFDGIAGNASTLNAIVEMPMETRINPETTEQMFNAQNVSRSSESPAWGGGDAGFRRSRSVGTVVASAASGDAVSVAMAGVDAGPATDAGESLCSAGWQRR